MANKIGIVLALDGEQKFAQGMKNAQQSAKLLKTNLTQLDAQYKGTANSMEALRAKQEALKNLQDGYNRVLTAAKTGQSQAKKAYKEQADALEKLRKEYEEAQDALKQMEKEGKQGTAEYEKQQAAVKKLASAVDKQTANYLKAEGRLSQWDAKVAQAETDVRKTSEAIDQNAKYMDEAAKSADGCATSIDKMGNEASEAAGEIDKGGSSLKDFLTIAGANLAASAIKEIGSAAKEAAKYVVEVGSRFEASMSKVQALSGASAAEMAQMESVAKELGSTTRFSASEVADGFSYMALAGWDAQASIAAIGGIVDLAAASEMDLAQASDMVTDYLSAFGMEASEAGKMADMMAYAQANSNTSTQQLGEAFGNCAANMHAAGQDMATTTSFLEAFANQGVKGSEAGTKLAAIMRDITAKMKDGKIQIGDTAVAVQDADGNFRDLTDIMKDVEAATDGMGTAERSAALAATFTSRSVGGLNMILAEGVDNIADYEKQLNNADGAASTMAKTMQDNLAGKVTAFDSAMEGLGIALYSYFSGPLSGAVELATGLLQGITAALTPQKTELETFISDVAAMNQETASAIQNAQQTVNAGIEKAETIAAFGETLQGVLTSCEEYNQITLDDGTTRIVSSTGEVVIGFKEIDGQIQITEGELAGFDATGLSADQIIQKAMSTKQAIGYIAEEAGSVEQKLATFASGGIDVSGVSQGTSAIIELVDGAGQSVGSFVSSVSEMGNVTIPTQSIKSGTDVIVSYIDGVTGAATTARGKITETGDVDIPDAKIKKGTSAFVQLFNAAGQQVGTFKQTVESTADIEIPVEGSAVDAATTAYITCWDDATKSVQTFKTTVGEIANGDFNLGNAASQFEMLENATRKTYVVTDAYTKMRIDSFVSQFGSSVQGLAQAWDTNTGSIQASKKELNEWFGVAQSVAMYNAYMEGVEQYRKAVVDAFVAVTKAESGVSAALDDYNKKYGTAFESYQEFSDWVVQHGGWGDSQYKDIQKANQGVVDAKENLETAQTELDTTGKALEEAAQAVDGFGIAINEETGQLEIATETTEDAGTATEDFTEDTEDATDAVKTYAEAVGDMEAKTKSAFDSAKQTVSDYFDSAAESARNAFSINPFESWEVNAENGMGKMQSAFDEQIQNMQEYSNNLQTVSKYVGTEITPEFMQYLTDLGEGGAQVMAELADALSSGDTAKVEELMKSYTDAMNVQDEIANVTAMNALAFAIGMGELGSSSDDWSEVRDNISKFSETVDQSLQDDLDTAIATAQKLGVKIPDELADSIENGNLDPTQAVQDITNLINQAIEGQAQGIADAAEAAGYTVPDGFVEAMTEGGPAAQQAWAELIASVSDTEVDTSGAESAGSEQAGAYADKISEGQGEAQSAAQVVADAAGAAIGTAVDKFSSAGTLAGVSFRTGITNYSGSAASAADAMATNAANAAGNHTGEFSSSGSSSAQNFVSGMNSVDATGAGNSLASSALSGASGYYDSFYSVGSNLGSGLNTGISAWTSTIAATASNAVSNAVAAAKAAADIHSPSRVFRDEVGKMIGAGLALGIEQSTGLVTDAAEAQMNQTLARLQQWLGRNRKQIEQTMGTSFADASSYSWQALAEQQIKDGFGISKKTTTGSGDDKKTINKSAEQFSKEVYQTAKQYMDNIKVLFDVSESEEEAYWVKVQQRLTRGTQAWFDATERINDLRKSQAEAAQKAAEEEAEAEEERKQATQQANADILSDAQKTMEHQQILHDVSLQDQLDFWKGIRSQLIKGSDEWYTATATIKDLQKQIREENEETKRQAQEAQAQSYADILSNAEEYVSKKKSLDQMSVKEEEQYWIKIREQLVKGTDEYKSATQHILEARRSIGTVSNASSVLDTFQTYQDMGVYAEMQYWAEVRKHYKKGTEERLAADKKYYAAKRNYESQLTQLQKTYADDRAAAIKSQNDQIAQEEQNLADRIRSINDTLAEDIAAANQRRRDSIKELKEGYREAVESAKQNIMNAYDIFSEFESSSVSGQQLLFNMQSQAAGYEDWMKSMQKLRKKGVLSDELMSEIESKGPQDSAAVHALLQLSKEQLQQYQDAYDRRAAVAEKEAKTENKALLKETAEKIQAVKDSVKEEIEKLRAAAKDQRDTARKESKENIDKLKQTTKDKLEQLRQTYIDNRTQLKTTINDGLLNLAKNIRTIASDEMGKLSQQMAKWMTSGIDSNSKSLKNSKSLTNLMDTKGFASGSKYLDEFFAWMDELGLGSEMIVRKSDGARLNTNVRPGDAIIPAASTENLWDWSKISPAELLNGLDRQQMLLSQYVAAVTSGVASMAAMNSRVLTADVAVGASGSGVAQLMSGMLALMEEYMPYIAERQTISVDGKELAGATAGYMSEELAMRARRLR